MSFQLGQRYTKRIDSGQDARAVIIQIVALYNEYVDVKCVQLVGHVYSWRVNEICHFSHEHMMYHFDYMNGQDQPE